MSQNLRKHHKQLDSSPAGQQWR